MSVDKAIEALAESWASIDGRFVAFVDERDNHIAPDSPNYTGHYDGYMMEAQDLAKRLRARGFEIISIRCASGPQPAADSPDSEPSLAVGATNSSEVQS